MSPTPVQDLLSELDGELTTDPTGPGIARILEDYSGKHDDWRRFAHCSVERYARNLIRVSELHELIVICWGESHVTPIHDHQGMRCWMSVLEGQIQETLYDFPAGRTGPMAERSRKTLARGEVAYISDDIALHEIRALDGPGVSLHLYSRPIAECRTFDPSTGISELRLLDYHSIGGELQAAQA